MSAVGSCYQATASEDYDRLKRPSVSYSDVYNVQNSESTILTCNFGLCVKVINKSD
jgi:hypothetical protein